MLTVFHFDAFFVFTSLSSLNLRNHDWPLPFLPQSCSKVLIEERERRTFLKRLRNPNLDGVQRTAILKALNAMCKKVTRCPHCFEFNGTVKKVSPLRLVHERYKASRKAQEADIAAFKSTFEAVLESAPEMRYHMSKAQDDLDPLRVLTLFQSITDEDCELLGLDPSHGRPEEFIWTSLPVPPVCIRPSVGQDGSSNEDDITVLLSDIVTVNARIRSSLKEGGDMKLLMEHWDFLQLQCAMFVNADLPGVANTPTVGRARTRRLQWGVKTDLPFRVSFPDAQPNQARVLSAFKGQARSFPW